ncbi:MAG TPA: glutamate 5-kinase [Candidatus Bilamarchaeum sp.]|nr:glutamate 5-kinase [Candidatus Bilamarchaeum sp.]
MRIVLKLGSSLLNGGTGINHIMIDQLASQIIGMKEHDFAIVTSGAISTGMKKLGFNEKPRDVALLQALAAVGQSDLMHAYENAFEDRKVLAQVLLTNRDFSDRMKYLNIRNTLNTLMGKGIVPIINENDTVTVMDIKKAAFGDNDTLAAHVAVAIDADLLIIFTNVDGLYDRNPKEKGAKIIRTVESVTDEQLAMCNGVSEAGRGGMLSKLRAAKIATEASVKVVVCNGGAKNALKKSIAEELGTAFLPKANPNLNERKHWLAFASDPKGRIVVNERAMQCAIGKNCGVVPADILEVSGNFDKGDVIEIACREGKVLCKGISNYFSHELEKIKGKSTDEIFGELGFAYADAVGSSDMAVAQ